MTMALRIPSRFNNDLDRLKTRLHRPSYPRAVISSPPTVSVLSDNATCDIPNSQFVPVTDPRIGFQGLADIVFNYNLSINDGIQRPYYFPYCIYAGQPYPWSIEIDTDAAAIGFLSYQGVSFNLFVDDQPAQQAAYAPTSSSGRHIVKVDFGSRRLRRVRFDGNLGGGGFAGFFIAEGDTILPASRPAATFTAVGDSYLQISGDTAMCDLAQVAAYALGGRIVQTDAFGGTGYLQRNAAAANGGVNNFLDRIGTTLTGNTKADIVMVLGGINDPATLAVSDVLSYLQAVRSRYSAAVIVVSGNWEPDPLYGRASPSFKAPTIWATILAAARQISGPWVAINTHDDSWENSSGVTKAGSGATLTFTGALSGATSATLTAAWQGAYNKYVLLFSDGSRRAVLLQNNSTSVSWSGAVTAGATAQVETGWQTGDGCAVTFTAALSGATSATLATAWALPTGSYSLRFSDGTTKTVTLTNGSTAVSWSGAVTATANAGTAKTAWGNAIANLSPDGTHPVPGAGTTALGRLLAERIHDGVMAL